MKNKMVKIILALCFCCFFWMSYAQAQELTFTATWNPNPLQEEVLGYNLYWRWGADTGYNLKINTTGLIPLTDNVGYTFKKEVEARLVLCFVLTAVNVVGESGYSNEVCVVLRTASSKPTGLKVVK